MIQNRAEKVIHCGTWLVLIFPTGEGQSLILVGNGRRAAAGIALAFGRAIGIAARGKEMRVIGQAIELGSSELSWREGLTVAAEPAATERINKRYENCAPLLGGHSWTL